MLVKNSKNTLNTSCIELLKSLNVLRVFGILPLSVCLIDSLIKLNLQKILNPKKLMRKLKR